MTNRCAAPRHPRQHHTAARLSDRDTFITPEGLKARWALSEKHNYEGLKEPGFPPKIRKAYRMDMIYAWEEGRRWPAEVAEVATAAPASPSGAPLALGMAAMPGRRKSASQAA
jgi:hypothetical protein